MQRKNNIKKPPKIGKIRGNKFDAENKCTQSNVVLDVSANIFQAPIPNPLSINNIISSVINVNIMPK